MVFHYDVVMLLCFVMLCFVVLLFILFIFILVCCYVVMLFVVVVLSHHIDEYPGGLVPGDAAARQGGEEEGGQG